MKKTIKLKAILWIAGIIALAAVIGFSMAACSNGTTSRRSGGGGGSGGNTNPTPIAKTLVIQNIPVVVYGYVENNDTNGIVISTMTDDAVAGAYLSNSDITVTGTGPYTITVPLYDISSNNRWTGSGTFDVYVSLSGGGGHYYGASSVKISSATTTISFNSFSPL